MASSPGTGVPLPFTNSISRAMSAGVSGFAFQAADSDG